jgi:PAS domain S-box-containing protein
MVVWLLAIVALAVIVMHSVSERMLTQNALELAAKEFRLARSAFDTASRHRALAVRSACRVAAGSEALRPDGALRAIVRNYEELKGVPGKLSTASSGLFDARGNCLSSSGRPSGSILARDARPQLLKALAGESVWGMLRLDGAPYFVECEPATYRQQVVGVLFFAFPAEAEAMEQAEGTGCSVAFLDEERLFASSLSPASALELQRRLEAGWSPPDAAAGGSMTLALEGRKYAAAAFPAAFDPTGAEPPGGAGPRILLLQDWSGTERTIAGLRAGLLSLAGVVLLLALVLGSASSRTVAQPIQDVAEAVGRLSSGQWDRRLAARGSEEARTLAEAFNRMADTLHGYEGEVSLQTTRLQRALERVQEENERFRSVFETASDAIALTDQRGKVVFWNDRARQLFGFGADDVRGRLLSELIASAEAESFAGWFRERRSADGDGSMRRFDWRRADGTEFPGEVSLSEWEGADGWYVTAAIRDLTERERAEAQLRERDEQLRQAQKMEALGRLAGGIAHDFNNLLAVISGYSGLALETAAEEDPARESMEEIHEAAARATGLTRQLLAFSRQQPATPEILDLNRIVGEMHKLLRRMAGKGIEVVLAPDPALGRVRADAGQIGQVLMNLVVNARDAMPSGGTVRVETSNVCWTPDDPQRPADVPPGRYVALSVSDTGCGMPPEVLPRIFEPFFTTKDAGKGTGLGLSTVYGIVQQSGGGIRIESRVGEGTSFHIYLPRIEGEE